MFQVEWYNIVMILISCAVGIFLGTTITLSLKRKTVDMYNSSNKPWIKHVNALPAVFPSTEPSVYAITTSGDDDGGSHMYVFKNCMGTFFGETEYLEEAVEIEFAKKYDDGIVMRGLQSEQLLIALVDRTTKLNKKYPCAENEAIISSLQLAINMHRKRVEDRISRGDIVYN